MLESISYVLDIPLINLLYDNAVILTDEEKEIYNLLKALIIATQDEQNAYIVDFIARVYHNYDFYGINNFDALPFTITTPDITKTNAHYTIKDDIAFISFNYQSIDYFLTVKGYENFTNINKNTITILLKELLL